MALKKMGIINNYDHIRFKTVVVVGVGGIGSVVAQMLTRCGIGKLILFDYDQVQLANMNRLFFTPAHVGLNKVDASKQSLHTINPDVQIQSYHINITSNQGIQCLRRALTQQGLCINSNVNESISQETTNKVDLLLSCVDNYSARMTVNKVCNQLRQVWLESGVSETALSGHIQLLIPGETGCFACTAPLAVVEDTENTIKREGVCAASLPTTMGIIAGLLAQNTLKLLLGFGSVSPCLSYNASTDFFNTYPIAPNPDCRDPSCLNAQKIQHDNPTLTLIALTRPKKKVTPSSQLNEWGIDIVEQKSSNAVTIKLDEGDSVQSLTAQLRDL